MLQLYMAIQCNDYTTQLDTDKFKHVRDVGISTTVQYNPVSCTSPVQ